MGIGEKIYTDSHITGFKEEIAKAAQQTDDRFFTWFNSAANTDAAFIRGQWDFALHIAAPLAPYLQKPEQKRVLEIGHGGGRILCAASRGFAKGFGVDIHDHNQLVHTELSRRGVHNVELLQGDGHTLPVPDQGVDVVYSFVVLQHVQKIKIFQEYVQEAFRILTPGGLALLYFGRKCFVSQNRSSPLAYWADRAAELLLLRGSYQEKAARINDINLIVSVPYARQVARQAGFQVLDLVVSRKIVPDGARLYGSQHGLVLHKP
jgi:ubiquinone/menaquinone biosynthesis C-methylase UbiE